MNGFLLYLVEKCNICKSSVLSHSVYIKCSICKALSHLACVPSLDKNDLLYINKCKDWICLICSSYIFPFNHLECDQEFKNA